MMPLPVTTPQVVSAFINFDLEDPGWTYHPDNLGLPATQAEGVAGIWNLLAKEGLALLADEVGTGKTLQALSTLALLWKVKPGARVLVLAPSQSVARAWQREFTRFLQCHFRHSDSVVMHKDRTPVHAPVLAGSLAAVVAAFHDPANRFVISKITIFSHLGDGRDDVSPAEKARLASKRAAVLHEQLLEGLDELLDLLVVDEAHYLRNVHGYSQRVNASRAFFGKPGEAIANRVLLLTATPNHTSNEDVGNLVSYFRAGPEAPAHSVLKRYAIRRLRMLQDRTKHSYREEQDCPCTFRNVASELFFALYQKRLAAAEEDGVPLFRHDKRRFLHGYLEGFESFQAGKGTAREVEGDPRELKEYRQAPDTRILNDLARQFGSVPDHPKYDQALERVLPVAKTLWVAPGRPPEEDKCLIFVRRIASTRELAERGNRAYDRLLLEKLLGVLGTGASSLDSVLRRANLRRALDELIRKQVGDDPGPEASGEAEDEGERDPGAAESQIMAYFRRNVRGGRWKETLGYRFRVRFTEGPFRRFFDAPSTGASPTLASIYAKLLKEPEREVWCRFMTATTARQEAFFQVYLRKGLLLASAAVVELYAWFLKAQLSTRRRKPPSYDQFCMEVGRGFPGSLTQRLMAQALTTFEELAKRTGAGLHSDAQFRAFSWSHLEALAPCEPCSGELHDREHLIQAFNTPFFPNLLITTSVLQEGVDLHTHCRKVMHYGIAWTPGDNEQRVGRIDRLFGSVHRNIRSGQRDQLEITYPHLAGSLDEDQVGVFLRKKFKAESVLDRGESVANDHTVDLSLCAGRWRVWLRNKTNSGLNADLKDPFPYLPGAEADPWWEGVMPSEAKSTLTAGMYRG
jgi:hypothetical protein